MTKKAVIASAGNTMAPALAALGALGYVVSRIDGSLMKAQSVDVSLVAEDPLLLLGLAKLFEMRGASWQASDEELRTWLSFDENV